MNNEHDIDGVEDVNRLELHPGGVLPLNQVFVISNTTRKASEWMIDDVLRLLDINAVLGDMIDIPAKFIRHGD